MGLCYTSGTTGRCKGAAYSHRSTYLHTLMICGVDQLLEGIHHFYKHIDVLILFWLMLDILFWRFYKQPPPPKKKKHVNTIF